MNADGWRETATERTTYDLTGTYDPCRSCHAPVVVPFPPDWTVGLRKNGSAVRITPHRPDCPTKFGCPQMVWAGPYASRCGKGAAVGECSTHGRFHTPAAEEPA